jgi:hypothetical protein
MTENGNERTSKDWPWFVILIAATAPMILYANNLGEVTLVSLWLPVVLSIVAGLAIFGLSYLIFKDILKAGLVTGIIEVLIFSYGHIYNLVKPLTLFEVLIGRHRYLFPFILLIFGFLLWRVIKSKGNFTKITLLLNIVTMMLFAFQFLRISIFEIKTYQQQREGIDQANQTAEMGFTGERPDIYIILLDGYMRSDWLADSIGYDNSAFIQELQSLGFYIPSCSRSNYSYTLLSMTSELNMAYLDNLSDPIEDIETSTLLKHSEVRKKLEGLGYETIFFRNFYPWVDITDGDYYFSANNVPAYKPFEILFLQTTILTLPYDLFERQLAELRWSPEYAFTTSYAKLIQSIFTYLQSPHEYEEPVFVYAHILSPHYPYVMNSDGTINYDWEDDLESSLLNTYQYIDNQTIKAVRAILKNTDTDPIIIIQSDHGLGEGAYKNLSFNAFLLPEDGEEMLYSTITPVNFFRIIFDYYFDMDYPLLADKSYFSPDDSHYDLTQVEDPYQNCSPQGED